MLHGVKGNTNFNSETGDLKPENHFDRAVGSSVESMRGVRLNSGLPSVFACATSFSPTVNLNPV